MKMVMARAARAMAAATKRAMATAMSMVGNKESPGNGDCNSDSA